MGRRDLLQTRLFIDPGYDCRADGRHLARPRLLLAALGLLCFGAGVLLHGTTTVRDVSKTGEVSFLFFSLEVPTYLYIGSFAVVRANRNTQRMVRTDERLNRGWYEERL